VKPRPHLEFPEYCDTPRECLARIAEEMYQMFEAGTPATPSKLLTWYETVEVACKDLYAAERFENLPEFDSRQDLN
jgi:hypothetical protein